MTKNKKINLSKGKRIENLVNSFEVYHHKLSEILKLSDSYKDDGSQFFKTKLQEAEDFLDYYLGLLQIIVFRIREEYPSGYFTKKYNLNYIYCFA